MTAWRSRMNPHRYAATFVIAICLAISLRTCSGQVAALGCKSGNVRYAGSKLPLLMGGVVDSCKEGCQPRNDKWSQACVLTPNNKPKSPTVRKCSATQTKAVVSQLLKDGDQAMLVLTPCELHQYLRGRTLWLIGDSLMQNYYFALRCLMLDFWDHSLGECQASPDSSTERAIYHAADTNISSPLGSRVITDVPRCLWLTAGGRICWLHSVRGEEIADPDPQEPGLLQTLQRTVAEPEDIFFVNFGRWHFNNCEGLQGEPYRLALWNLGRLYQRTKGEFPNLVFKVSAHDHTACSGSKQARLQQVEGCLPAEQGGYPLGTGRQVMLTAESILGSLGVPLVNTYNETVKLNQGHITDRPLAGREVDCIHYCSPGVPEFEMWSMYKAFRLYGIQPLPAATAQAPSSRRSRRRRARVHAANSSSAAPAAAVSEDHAGNYLNVAMVDFNPVSSSSSSEASSSSSSSRGGVAAASLGSDSLSDLIGWVGRNPASRTPPPAPTPKPPPVRKDPSPKCIPVTAKVPPHGWSYYYDSLMKKKQQGIVQMVSPTGVAEQEQAMEKLEEGDALGTCTGDEF